MTRTPGSSGVLGKAHDRHGTRWGPEVPKDGVTPTTTGHLVESTPTVYVVGFPGKGRGKDPQRQTSNPVNRSVLVLVPEEKVQCRRAPVVGLPRRVPWTSRSPGFFHLSVVNRVERGPGMEDVSKPLFKRQRCLVGKVFPYSPTRESATRSRVVPDYPVILDYPGTRV